MMKLKYLFDNRELTHMILKNWDHDSEKLDILDYASGATGYSVFMILQNHEILMKP